MEVLPLVLPVALAEAELLAAAPAAVELDPKMTAVELVVVVLVDMELDPKMTVVELVVVVLVV